MTNTNKERLAYVQARHRARNFAKVIEYLEAHPCVECGITNPIVLDFDHLPGTDKKFEVSRAVQASTRSWALIESEIAKCEVVCANCHRIRTAERANHRKHQIFTGEYLAKEYSNDTLPKGNEHGGGVRGRRGCKCDLCKSKNAEYSRLQRGKSKG